MNKAPFRFIICINEAKHGESQTAVVVAFPRDTTRFQRWRVLRKVLRHMGVPQKRLRYTMNALGFTGRRLQE